MKLTNEQAQKIAALTIEAHTLRKELAEYERSGAYMEKRKVVKRLGECEAAIEQIIG